MQHQAVIATGRFHVAPEDACKPFSYAAHSPQSGSDRGGARTKGLRRGIVLPLLAGIVLLGSYVALVQRVHVVRFVPGAAGLFRALGLPVNIFQAEFQNIRANLTIRDGEAQLVVEGQIRNTRAAVNPLKDVQLSLLGSDGAAVYSWVVKLPQKSLKPGEILGFKTSLVSPPAGNHSVAVSFAP